MEEDHEHGEMHFALTEDEQLVVTCPIHGCHWAGLKPVGWEPLPSFMDVEDVVRPHIDAWHDEVEVNWEGIREASTLIGAYVVHMLVDNESERDKRCIARILKDRNEQTQGAVEYVLRQEAIGTDTLDRFEDWWPRTMEHAESHANRPKLTNVAEFLKDMLGDDVHVLDLTSDSKKSGRDWKKIFGLGDDDQKDEQQDDL